MIVTNYRQLAYQATLDALALRGPDAGGGGFIVTAQPAEYLSGDRLRLAQEALACLPAGATTADAAAIAEQIEPRIISAYRRS
jgi:hypothetical protein